MSDLCLYKLTNCSEGKIFIVSVYAIGIILGCGMQVKMNNVKKEPSQKIEINENLGSL